MASVTVTSAGGDWVNAVSSAFLDVVARSAGLRFCLATGETPAPAHHQLASSGLDLSSITVALLDEFGGLDADDPGRGLAMLERDLLGRLKAADRPLLELIDVNERPDPDWPGPSRLAVLGIGENGHIGMNEPGSAPDIGTRRVLLAPSRSIGALRYGARHASTWGVTIGLVRYWRARSRGSWRQANPRRPSSPRQSTVRSRRRSPHHCFRAAPQFVGFSTRVRPLCWTTDSTQPVDVP